jgi:hypothetical protein
MPLKATDAKKLIRRLLDDGVFRVSSPHGRKAMDDDNLNDVDAVNVLRAGVPREAEWENGAWRYHMETQRMCFVVEFEPEVEVLPDESSDVSEMEVVVVTAWRKNR